MHCLKCRSTTPVENFPLSSNFSTWGQRDFKRDMVPFQKGVQKKHRPINLIPSLHLDSCLKKGYFPFAIYGEPLQRIGVGWV